MPSITAEGRDEGVRPPFSFLGLFMLCRSAFWVTIFFSAFYDTLRAVFTQERFTDVLGKFVLLYLFNRMGHA